MSKRAWPNMIIFKHEVFWLSSRRTDPKCQGRAGPPTPTLPAPIPRKHAGLQKCPSPNIRLEIATAHIWLLRGVVKDSHHTEREKQLPAKELMRIVPMTAHAKPPTESFVDEGPPAFEPVFQIVIRNIYKIH